MTGFAHPALFYRGADEYLAGTVPFIREGLDAGDPVAVAVPGPKLELLRAELGPDAERVRLIDMTRAGRNPGRIIPGVLRAFADAQPGDTRPRIIGEPIWPSRTGTEYPACVQHEALINLAFAGRNAAILCPFDTEGLAPCVLADAAATHPVLADAGGLRPSRTYAPERIVEAYNLPLSPPPRHTVAFRFAARTLAEARLLATGQATRAGLPDNRVTDLGLAVSELATNTIVHGGGSGTLRVWAGSGGAGSGAGRDERLVCEVRDRGHLTDPLVGRRPVEPTAIGGRGILMVHHLADLVRIHSTEKGTVIRVYFAAN